MRIGEALGLRWSDLNPEEATLKAARTLSRERGGKARFGSPKSGKARSISLTPLTVEALRHHRTRQAARRLAAPAWVDGSDLVLTDPVGGPLRRDTVYRRHFAPLLAKAGYRRTRATTPSGTPPLPPYSPRVLT